MKIGWSILRVPMVLWLKKKHNWLVLVHNSKRIFMRAVGFYHSGLHQFPQIQWSSTNIQCTKSQQYYSGTLLIHDGNPVERISHWRESVTKLCCRGVVSRKETRTLKEMIAYPSKLSLVISFGLKFPVLGYYLFKFRVSVLFHQIKSAALIDSKPQTV